LDGSGEKLAYFSVNFILEWKNKVVYYVPS
jgi:hypothetical protein